MIMKKLIIILLTLSISGLSFVYGQMAVGYNTDGNTLLLSTSPLKTLWGEFRINTKAYNQASWTYSDRGITQLYLSARVFNAQNVIFYAGGGLGANLLSEDKDKWLSINIPAGIRIQPFTKYPGLLITGEYNPMFVVEEDVPIIHSVSAGLRILLIKGE